MKIMYVVGPLATGILTYLINLTDKLIDKADITVVYGVWPETPDNPGELFDKRIKLIQIESFKREISLKDDLKTAKEIKKIANEIKPDVIHMHSSKAGALGRALLSNKKSRLFYTPHGYAFLMNVSGKKKAVYHIIEKLLAKRAVTIACSKSEYEIALTLCKKAECIDNGIDLDKFKNNTSFDIPRVYTSGRVSEQKNAELFNEIASNLPDTEFTWIGAGPEEDKLTAKNITVTGWVDRNSALDHASRGNIFLLPSKWEGLSISLLEAMAEGKLCIVSDIPGNLNAIVNGENGIVCKSLNEYVQTIENYKDYIHLAKNAVKSVEEKFSTDVMAEKYFALYSKQ